MIPAPQREEALFEAAAQLTGAERAAFLNGACHGDPALRQRLDALLAAREQPDTILATQPEPARSTIKLDLADAKDEAVVARHYSVSADGTGLAGADRTRAAAGRRGTFSCPTTACRRTCCP